MVSQSGALLNLFEHLTNSGVSINSVEATNPADPAWYVSNLPLLHDDLKISILPLNQPKQCTNASAKI